MIDRYYAARHTLELVGKWLDAFDPHHFIGPDSPVGDELGTYMIRTNWEAMFNVTKKLMEVPEIVELVENGLVAENKSLPQCFRDLLANQARWKGHRAQVIIGHKPDSVGRC